MKKMMEDGTLEFSIEGRAGAHPAESGPQGE